MLTVVVVGVVLTLVGYWLGRADAQSILLMRIEDGERRERKWQRQARIEHRRAELLAREVTTDDPAYAEFSSDVPSAGG